MSELDSNVMDTTCVSVSKKLDAAELNSMWQILRQRRHYNNDGESILNNWHTCVSGSGRYLSMTTKAKQTKVRLAKEVWILINHHWPPRASDLIQLLKLFPHHSMVYSSEFKPDQDYTFHNTLEHRDLTLPSFLQAEIKQMICYSFHTMSKEETILSYKS